MLCTLYLRAYESRSEHSILADHAAAAAVDRIDYDFARIKRYVNPSSNQFTVTLRAKQFDLWAADFLGRHPDATVLHLACGLDSRAFRLAPPAGVRWFDVDLPAVIELRRQVYPEHDRYRMIGSSVTDPSCWTHPHRSPGAGDRRRPVHVPHGKRSPTAAPATDRSFWHRRAAVRRSGAVARQADEDLPLGHPRRAAARTLEPRLKCVATTSALEQFSRIPVKSSRTLFRLWNAIPGARKLNPLFRFEL